MFGTYQEHVNFKTLSDTFCGICNSVNLSLGFKEQLANLTYLLISITIFRRMIQHSTKIPNSQPDITIIQFKVELNAVIT